MLSSNCQPSFHLPFSRPSTHLTATAGGGAAAATMVGGSKTADPFSCLPDSILEHIISLLPFEDAARTPAISHRWLRVWPCSRKIVLDDRPFTDRAAFLAFARRFASRYREPKVHSFLLRFSRPHGHLPEVRDWLRLATRASAGELDLDFSSDSHSDTPAITMPDDIYQLSHSLRSLRLSGCEFDAAMFGSFAALRVLSIETVELPERSLDVLMSYCRCLEDLTLKKLTLEGVSVVDRNGQLLTLRIEGCRLLSWGVVVEAPMLKYFKYSGSIEQFALEVPKVEEASLDFGMECEFNANGDLLCSLLDSLSSAKVLSLCSYITQVIASGEEPFCFPAPIGHLKHLILRTELHRDELPGIALLLRGYQKLESVTFEMGCRNVLEDYEYPFLDISDGYYFWQCQFLPIPCLEVHLKKVRIVGFEGKVNEMAILSFLLQRSKVLEEIFINITKKSRTNVDKYFSTAQGLLHYKKVSPHVKILIS